jgi:hypothetical protein
MAYTATYNRTPFLRGDTLLGWGVDIEIADQPAQLLAARLQLRTTNGRLVYDWPASVNGSRIQFPDVPASITANWPVGVLLYDLEVTLADGRVATWLQGEQCVVADRSY